MPRKDMSQVVSPIGGPIGDTQRPVMVPRVKTSYLFHDVGPSWGRVRDIKDHKGGKVEGNFSHLHDKFAG